MHLTTQQVLVLTEETLKSFLSLRISEGLYLDYKERLSATSDKDAKREFLKDVTAFANAAGGLLLLGVKEPSDRVAVEAQLVGIDQGDALAQDLERLASTSIDPRIPGLRIVSVPLASGKSCVAVYIPPSLSRPHMVNYAGHRSFYVRHSESSFPMTTHEVRESVLTSLSAEARARSYVERRLTEVRDELDDRKPTLFLQAMPLISPETSWDVLSTPFENVLRGQSRLNKYNDYADLVSNIAPRPTIDGLLAQDDREQPTWQTEIHRIGYVSALYQNFKTVEVENVDRFFVYPGICDIFRAFCHILKELIETSSTDLPYLVTCAYLNASGTCMWIESRRGNKFSKPYLKKDIIWPEHVRPTGIDPMTIAESLCLEMFNAFGSKQVVK